MIPLPRPRGFWDYALFALALTGALVGVFQLEASHVVRWADAALALAAAVFCVLVIILSRRNETASWIVRPTWRVNILVTLGAFLLMFGAIYADTYILHPMEVTPNGLRRDIVLGLALAVAIFLAVRRGNTGGRLSS